MSDTAHTPVRRPTAISRQQVLLIVLAVAVVTAMWLPVARLTFVNAGTTNEQTFSVFGLLRSGSSFAAAHDLGMFAGATPVNQLALLWVVPILAAALVLFALAGAERLFRWLYLSGIAVLVLIPVYSVVSVAPITQSIAGLQSFGTTFAGFVVPLACALVFILLSGNFAQKPSSTRESLETEDQRTVALLIVLSIATVLSTFLPVFSIDYRVGMAQVQSYPFNLYAFLRVSPQVNVVTLYSLVRAGTNLSFMRVFLAVPVLGGISVALLLTGARRSARISLIIQGVTAALTVAVIVTILKTNTPVFDGVERVSVGIGGVALFAGGIGMLVLLSSRDDRSRIPDPLKASRRSHDRSYVIVAVAAGAALVSPQFGLRADVVDALSGAAGRYPSALKIPFTLFRTASLTGNVPSYLVYVAGFALIALLVSVAVRKPRVARISAMTAGLALLIGCFSGYAALASYVGETGTVQVRIAALITSVLGIVLANAAYTDSPQQSGIQTAERRSSSVIKYTVLIGFAIVQLYPVFWLILASFMSESEIFSGRLFLLPEVWHGENYFKALFGSRAGETFYEAVRRVMGSSSGHDVFQYIIGATPEGNIVRYFGNSLIVVAISVAFIVILAAMAAYALQRMRWRGRRTMYVVFTLGLMIPVHVALAPLYISFSNIGVLGSLLSLIIPYVGFGLPLSIVVFYGFMGQIPYEIEEAASMDGVGRIRGFFSLIMPISAPAIATVTIFSFLGSWNELMFATTFINEGARKTITVGVHHLATAQYTREYGLTFAGLVIASLPTVIYYLFASNQVQKSLTVGSVKG